MNFRFQQSLSDIQRRCGWIRLADAPSPVEPLSSLETEFAPRSHLYAKRDELYGREFGATKVRKLELFLGMALRASSKSVLTFGAAGSNHVLATAIHASALGLSTTCLVQGRPLGPRAQRNLIATEAAGVRLVNYSCRLMSPEGAALIARESDILARHSGTPPFIIPFGGRGPVGAVGSLNGAFELARQIEAGEAPCPDYIYIASATLGTAAGLALGLKLTGLPTRLIAVRVADSGTEEDLFKVAFQAYQFLTHYAADFPCVRLTQGQIQLLHDFAQPAYGIAGPETAQAATVAGRHGLILDEAYSAKAFAAYLAAAQRGDFDGKTACFWNTTPRETVVTSVPAGPLGW
jgi:D-cysteine desulfhydrase